MEDTREYFNKNRDVIYREMGRRVCDNCKQNGDLQVHHIVPLSCGGTNRISNLCVLCDKCHAAVHGFAGSRKEQFKELQRQGIEKARREGKYRGRKKDEVKRSAIKECIISGMSVRKTAEKCECSTYTVHQVKKEMN